MVRLILFFFTLLLVFDPAVLAARSHRKYVLKKGDTPAGVAKRFKITPDELFRYNSIQSKSEFKYGLKLTIPFPGEVTGSKYVVKSGDSIAKIADFHGISQNDLRDANGLSKSRALRVGRELTIPKVLRKGALDGHVVRKGDTIASIAKKHSISVKLLLAENKLTKDSALRIGKTLIIPDREDEPSSYKRKKINKLLKTGKVVSRGVLHTVQPGQSIWLIARAYNTSGKKIAIANGFKKNEAINPGKKILIPGAKEVVPVRVKGYTTLRVTFIRSINGERKTVKLLTKNGKVRSSARRVISKIARAKRGRRKFKLLHKRLIHMIQRVAERYPGFAIEVVSGYRPGERGEKISKHNLGRAIDFRVLGIENKELFNFIKELPRIGAGYYPNSIFVHMDVRDKTVTWTDYSGVGEKPRYGKKSSGGEFH